MANDLNFDELDEAVNDYMSKSSRPTPSSPRHEVPAPEPHKVEAAPLPTPTIERPAPAHAANAHAPRLQLQSRQTLAARRSSGVTFHDIAPPKRFNTAPDLHPPTEARTVTPPNEAEIPTVSAPEPTESPVTGAMKHGHTAIDDLAPTPSETPKEEKTGIEEPPELASIREELSNPETLITEEPSKKEEPSETEAAEDIGVAAAESEIEPPAFVRAHEEQPVKVLSDETAAGGEDEKFMHRGTGNFSDALLDDLKEHPKEVSPPPAISDDAKLSFGAEEKMGTDVGNGMPAPKQELDLIEEPSPVENKGGLMNTGELHANNLLGDSHETNQNSSFGQDPAVTQTGGGIFDTKEYHTPIGEHPKGTGNKAMGIIVAIILLIVIGVGAFAAYTVFFASTSL